MFKFFQKYFWIFLFSSSALFPGCGSKSIESIPGYAEVNGIKMYYEVHGTAHGIPLVLLPGGGSTIDATFSKVIPLFAKHRKVIATEEQGHGRTEDRDKPFRFETSAEDVAALLTQLKIEKVDLFGFSNGASVALQVAIKHPALVRKLIFASSVTKKNGARPFLWKAIKDANFTGMPQALKDSFLKVNPDPAKLKSMCEKDIERMRNFKDVPDSDVRSVKASTLILTGDHDIVKPEHAMELTQMIPGSRLLVLPASHGDYIGEVTTPQKDTRYPEYTAGMIEEFLDAK